MWTPEVFYPMAKRCAFLRTLLKETAEAEAMAIMGNGSPKVEICVGTSRKIESVWKRNLKLFVLQLF